MMDERSKQDEGSGSEKGLKTNKPEQSAGAAFTADVVDADDPHKVEKLAKAGRDDAPPEASE